MFLNVLWQLKLIPEILALIDNFISEKVSQLHNVVYVVTVFNVVWLVDHSHVVENIVFTGNELEQYDAHWPNV